MTAKSAGRFTLLHRVKNRAELLSGERFAGNESGSISGKGEITLVFLQDATKNILA